MHLETPQFACFFAAVALLHWALPDRWRNAWLLAASYAFFVSRHAQGAFLLALITCSSYLFAKVIRAEKGARARAWLWAAVVLHVTAMMVFKTASETWAMPLGLSYASFISLGYVLDAARGQALAEGPVSYGLFVGFFPHIVAGPVARSRTLLPQLQSPRRFDWDRGAEGLHLILWGLFQKAVFADNLRLATAAVFDGPVPVSGLGCLLGVYAFTLQLYADFAGYTNLARGMAKILGLELQENFKLPFFAKDMQEHWKRWHVSLSEWFADFVYRPMIDLPLGYYKFYAAPIATMLLMGLWHRPSAQMAALGLNYGVVIALTIFVKSWAARRSFRLGPAASAALPWLNRLLTFHLVCLGFILLRARSLGHAGALAAGLFQPYALTPLSRVLAQRVAVFGGTLLALDAVDYARGGVNSLARLPVTARAVLYAGVTAAIVSFGNPSAHPFFYARF